MRQRGKHRAPGPVNNGLYNALRKYGFVALAGCTSLTGLGSANPAVAEEKSESLERQVSTQPVVMERVAYKEKVVTTKSADFDQVFYRAELTSTPAPEPEPLPEVDPVSESVSPSSATAVHMEQAPVVEPWVKPVKSYRLTSTYGYRDAIPAAGTSAGLHNGVDFAAPLKTPILAASGGTVVHVGFSDFDTHTGGIVVIHHETPDGGYLSSYNHMKLSDIFVNVGDTVSAGDQIALMGTEGMSTGSHLHFTMRQVTGANPLTDWEYLDPMVFFANQGVNL